MVNSRFGNRFQDINIIKSSELHIIQTGDGSHTLFHPGVNQHYHSTFGALQESRHIFIETGFRHAIEKFHHIAASGVNGLSILEVGFGTGLNALVTLIEAEKSAVCVHYTAIEPTPLEESYWSGLNYPQFFGNADHSKVFARLHQAAWDKPDAISPFFTLLKKREALETYQPRGDFFHLVYFDAFGPDAQPELWTEAMFGKIAHGLAAGGIMVTYSVKGSVVRTLHAEGFATEKIPGPPGKRHILRATKNI